MNAKAVIQRATELGIALNVAGDRIQYRPKSKAPADFVDELRQHKPEIIDSLRRRGKPCTACLCDKEIEGGKGCDACAGDVCVACGGCLRAAELWRYAERYARYLHMPVDELLQRLRTGSQWLCEQHDQARDNRPSFTRGLDRWYELELVLRSVHGYKGCIFDGENGCGDNTLGVCSACQCGTA